MPGEPGPAVILLGRLVGVDHRAHGAVEDEDALGEDLFEAGAESRLLQRSGRGVMRSGPFFLGPIALTGGRRVGTGAGVAGTAGRGAGVGRSVGIRVGGGSQGSRPLGPSRPRSGGAVRLHASVRRGGREGQHSGTTPYRQSLLRKDQRSVIIREAARTCQGGSDDPDTPGGGSPGHDETDHGPDDQHVKPEHRLGDG